MAGASAFPWLVTPYQYPSSPGFFCCFARCCECAALLSLWLCAHLQSGRGFLMLPACPSGSGYTGSFGFSSPLGFPTFAMGSPLRGRGWSVLNQNEGLVSIEVRYTGQFLAEPPASVCGYLRARSLRVCYQVVLTVFLTFSSP